jgi:hypothetical protein
MENKPQAGYFILADISGFVAYLTNTELAHAQAILSELLALITNRFTPILTVSQWYGDAVFAYAPTAHILRGETLLELIESTYGAFRDRLAGIRRRTTCTCQACRALATLDLKFLVHYGEYMPHAIGVNAELVGLDVDLVRKRMLKDQMTDNVDWRGYALFTESSLSQLRMPTEGMRTQSGTYEYLGEIKTYCLDLQVRYQAMSDARHMFVMVEEAYVVLTYDFDVAPTIVWEWLNDFEKRHHWMQGRTWSVVLRPGGRTGAGARNHCHHGMGTIIETVLDWRPFDYFTVELSLLSGLLAFVQTYQLESLADGHRTRLHSHTKLHRTWPRWLAQSLCAMGVRLMLKPDLDRMAHLIAAETLTQNRIAH